MRRVVRFLVGVALGGGAVAGYLAFVGPSAVFDRVSAVSAAVLAVVALLVVIEGVVDGVGVWASMVPLGGLSPGRSVQFALAGDFFDTLSPAGPVSSEPIMARFFAVATGEGYSDALGVRAAAKYVKSGAQLVVSLALGSVLLLGGSPPSAVVTTLGGALVVLVAVGAVLLGARRSVSAGLVAVLAPPITRLAARLGREVRRETVASAVERFWTRIVRFRDAPRLVGLIALGGAAEQVLTATVLWVALEGAGVSVPLLPILVVIPLPQAASVVPIPASLGAYDLLVAGALTLAAGAPASAAAAAVLVVRTTRLPFALGAGGTAVAFLRGWRLGS
ncbi:MAG: lysylphosphatidylglycerol synthase domain-containing protein [Halobaculum sp.]